MKYRNIKNGAVIDISSTLTDKSWEPITPNSNVSKEEAPKKTVKKKKA